MAETILEILAREPIRLLDGRYSTGFVSTTELNALVEDGKVGTDMRGGMRFVVALPAWTVKPTGAVITHPKGVGKTKTQAKKPGRK